MPCGLHGLCKAEWNHTFSPNFFLNAKYAYYGWGYGFDAAAAAATRTAASTTTLDRPTAPTTTSRPASPGTIVERRRQLLHAAAWAASTSSSSASATARTPARTTTTFSGNQIAGHQQRRRRHRRPGHAAAQRGASRRTIASGYLGDTFTKGRLTLNVGVRYDHQHAVQRGRARPPPNPPSRTSCPARLRRQRPDDHLERLLAARERQLRARRVAQDGAPRLVRALRRPALPERRHHRNPVGGYSTFLAYSWNDRNGDHFAPEGRDPARTRASSTTTTSTPPNPRRRLAQQDRPRLPREQGQRDHRGHRPRARRQLRRGRAYTWRKVTDVSSCFPRIGMTSADYTAERAGHRRTASPAQTFSPEPGQGRGLQQRPHPHQPAGLQHRATTASSSRSSSGCRTSGSRARRSRYMDWHENLGPGAIQNPTRTDTTGGQAGAAQSRPLRARRSTAARSRRARAARARATSSTTRRGRSW